MESDPNPIPSGTYAVVYSWTISQQYTVNSKTDALSDMFRRLTAFI